MFCIAELTNMADENSTAKPFGYIFEDMGLQDALFDTAWKLALTVEFCFKYAGLVVGIFGIAAKALVLYSLIVVNARDAKKRAISLLIINQNLLELSCCLLLVISVCVQINNTYLTGAFGNFVCAIFLTDTVSYCAIYGSIINLVALTVERYLKVVHPFWSKEHLKRWMVHAAMALAWITGIVSTAPASFIMSRLEDGIFLSDFESPKSDWVLGSCTLVIFFTCPLIVFIYCYGRIVVVMRRQMRVMAGHNAEGSAQVNAALQMRWNIIKTMIIVSLAFTICWLPHNILLVLIYSLQSENLKVAYYPTVFLAYLNICMNPLIYALKHEGVKTQLARMFACLKPSHVGDAPGSSSHQASETQTQETRTGVMETSLTV